MISPLFLIGACLATIVVCWLVEEVTNSIRVKAIANNIALLSLIAFVLLVVSGDY